MLTLVLGGARSGKSRHAQSLAAASGEPVVFVATAVSADPEMAERIARHRADRPRHWETREEALDVAAAVRAAEGVVLVDCVTIWISNLLYAHRALSPAESSYAATVQTFVGFYGVCSTAAIALACYALARRVASLLDSERRNAFDHARLLWHYVVCQSLAGLALIHGFPRWAQPS